MRWLLPRPAGGRAPFQCCQRPGSSVWGKVIGTSLRPLPAPPTISFLGHSPCSAWDHANSRRYLTELLTKQSFSHERRLFTRTAGWRKTVPPQGASGDVKQLGLEADPIGSSSIDQNAKKPDALNRWNPGDSRAADDDPTRRKVRFVRLSPRFASRNIRSFFPCIST
jgi:hypothetical protein